MNIVEKSCQPVLIQGPYDIVEFINKFKMYTHLPPRMIPPRPEIFPKGQFIPVFH